MTSNTDVFTLDETLAGRLTQAGMAGVSLALPDYVSSRAGRFLLNTLITLGGVGLVAYLNSIDQDPRKDPARVMGRMRQEFEQARQQDASDEDTPAVTSGSKLRMWLVLGGSLLAAFAVSRLEAGGRRWLVRKLRDRGVKRPHTVIGAIGALLVYVFTEIMYRDSLARLTAEERE